MLGVNYRRYTPLAVTFLKWEGALLVGTLAVAYFSGLITTWLVVFLILAAGGLLLAWVPALEKTGGAVRYRDKAGRWGVWLVATLYTGVGVSSFWRVSSRVAAVVFVLVYVVAGIKFLRWLRKKDSPAEQVRLTAALSVGPVIGAWFVTSMLYLALSGVLPALTGSRPDDARRARTLRERSVLVDAWSEQQHAPVAVALSGGGYRAAVAHAGLLSALDDGKIPVHTLSTVSGGSITGATYALGWRPEDFRAHLARTRPGLPNDFVNIMSVFKAFLIADHGSGDSYAAHFNRVYFHGQTISQSGPPTLILNATSYLDGKRRAFWPARDPGLPMARLVAASGAFPIVFDPVRIGDLAYMDGGVVDNLGVAGLQHYFDDELRPDIDPSEIPGILIISDVSNLPDAPRSWRKHSLPQMARHAQQVSYNAIHSWIYALLTQGKYDRTAAGPSEQPYEVEAGLLWPGLPIAYQRQIVRLFILSPISPAERHHFAGHEELLDEVSEFMTLKELSSKEVDAAFWVGRRVALGYLPQICRAAGVETCPGVELSSPPG